MWFLFLRVTELLELKSPIGKSNSRLKNLAQFKLWHMFKF
jgi:hypothetical protein